MAKITTRYQIRKADRLNGRPMKSRHGQGDPWYTWRTPGISNAISGPAALERELTKFGEVASYRERFAADRARERAELAGQVVAPPPPPDAHENPRVDLQAKVVRAIVKRGAGGRDRLPSQRPLPKFPDLSTPQI